MRAAVVAAPGRVEMVQRRIPAPGPNEVRVRLDGCGVCASNLPPWEGRPWFAYPFAPGALGHEGWGVVDVVGEDVTRVAAGARVAVLSQHAYAEFDVAPQDAVVPLPRAWGSARLFPGEPLGCAVNVATRSRIKAGDTVAVIGVGFLGALLVRLATQAGARVLAVSRRPFALDVARAMGATETIAMPGDKNEHWRVIERVRELTGGALCPIVIEAVGKQDALDLAGGLTGVRGRLVIAGYHQDGLRCVDLQQWNWCGLDVINAHERDERVYVDGIRKAVKADLPVEALLTHTFPLEQLGDALDLTRERPDGFLKAVLSYR